MYYIQILYYILYVLYVVCLCMHLIPHRRCLSSHNLPGPAHANDAQPPDVTGAAVAGSGLSFPFESQQVITSFQA